MSSGSPSKRVRAEGAGAGPTFPEPAALGSVAAFHDKFRAPRLARPVLPDAARSALRVSLLQEELDELRTAVAAGDLTEVADALADLQYVLSGAVHEFGMGGCFKELFDEVHRSNMSKACATLEEAEATVKHYAAKDGTEATIEPNADGTYNVYRTADNKCLKSVRYSPADLPPILQRAKATEEPAE